MQTFLPYADFDKSAKALDYKRLGKQRLECQQILNALERGGGWSSHPAVHMWTGYESALKLYMDAMVREWVSRGYNNSYPLWYGENPPAQFPTCSFADNPTMEVQQSVPMPIWLGDEEFHKSHRYALLLKNDYYDQHNWPEMDDGWDFTTPLDKTYWWPRLYEDEQGEPMYVLKRKGDY